MNKETLTLFNIKKDLYRKARSQLSNMEDWRLTLTSLLIGTAFALGIRFNSLWIGLVIFSPAVYHIFWFFVAKKEYKAQIKSIQRTIDRAGISISIEKLSHITRDTVYEPYTRRRKVGWTKTITVYHFESGNSWRAPRFGTLYDWSTTHYLSCKGLEDISAKGNEFFYISLQGYPDVIYVYPCKLFELDRQLRKSSPL